MSPESRRRKPTLNLNEQVLVERVLGAFKEEGWDLSRGEATEITVNMEKVAQILNERGINYRYDEENKAHIFSLKTQEDVQVKVLEEPASFRDFFDKIFVRK